MAKSKITYKSHSEEMQRLMDKSRKAALLMVGEFILSTIVLKMTKLGIVDTGRLRASMSYIVGKFSSFGKKVESTDKLNQKDKPRGAGKEDRIVFGTNVRYAEKQEKLRPYMKPGVEESIQMAIKLFHDVYKRVMDSG